jgi:hypothetical protein
MHSRSDSPSVLRPMFRPIMANLTSVQFAFAGALLFVVTTAVFVCQAQTQPMEPPAAPVPSQIVNAHKVFIANATGDHDPRVSKYFGGPDGIYNQFYADIQTGGRFEPVSAPANADIVVQVTLGTFPLVAGYAGFRLSIFDPKTNVLLWTASEPVDPAFLAKTARKNITESLQRLATDLQTLTLSKVSPGS